MQNIKPSAKYLILAAAVLASGMAFLDGSTTNIALPTIQAQFHAGISQLQWVVNAFMLSLASLLLLSGSLGDRFGRKKIFLLGIGVFVVASLLSGLSHSALFLALSQALQGIGAALMIPGSLAIINHTFESAERGRVIGLWAGLSGGIATLGPLAGGWLIQHFGWPMIFYINIPLGILAFIVAAAVVPESANPQAKKLDFVGAALIVFGLLSLTYGLIQGPSRGWGTPIILAALGAAVIFIGTFFWYERHHREPLLPLSLFRSPLVLGANLATLLVYFTLTGMMFFLVLNLQQVQGYSPIATGLSLLPATLIITFLSGFGGSLADKFGPRRQMIVAPLIVSAAMLLLARTGVGANYWIDYFPGLTLFGIGMCLFIAPLTKSALAVDSAHSGVASGVNNAVSRLAGLLAVALLGAIVAGMFSHYLAKTLQARGVPAEQKSVMMSQSDKLATISIPQNITGSEHDALTAAVQNSFVKSFRLAMIINAALAALASVVAFFYIRKEA
jgi:EmrB/QacA subfamily drug resistance transporter